MLYSGGNMGKQITVNDADVELSINPAVYPLDVVYSASYVFLDRAYVLLDGDPKEEITVTLKPKKEEDLEALGGEFFNELLNYADYKQRAAESQKIRELLLQRALVTNDPSVIDEDPDFDEILKELEEDNEPNVVTPWDNETK